MNERIKELAEDAGGHYSREELEFAVVFGELEDFERFAELIVIECIDVLHRRYMGDQNREDMEIRRCIEDIKQYFGVE